MKVLFVDISTSGHHLTYLSALALQKDIEPVLVLPEKVDMDCKQYVVARDKHTLSAMNAWLKNVLLVAQKEKPDIIHFLYGDIFYRFFGFGLGQFKKFKTVVTLHWVKTGFVERISTKMLCTKMDRVVVHSEYIRQVLQSYGVKNAVHIEYPQFNELKIPKEDACQYFGLEKDVPVIACIGNTRYDKGLDILLEALKRVNAPFRLLIAGKAEAFDEDYIAQHIAGYEERVTRCLYFLSDEELSNALCASDLIVLPYRKKFDGASGPLGEGVALGKCIVGPNHGTLGYTIEQNHLGYTFESENADDLAHTLDIALQEKFYRDEVYSSYKNSLRVDYFKDKYQRVYHDLMK